MMILTSNLERPEGYSVNTEPPDSSDGPPERRTTHETTGLDPELRSWLEAFLDASGDLTLDGPVKAWEGTQATWKELKKAVKASAGDRGLQEVYRDPRWVRFQRLRTKRYRRTEHYREARKESDAKWYDRVRNDPKYRERKHREYLARKARREEGSRDE